MPIYKVKVIIRKEEKLTFEVKAIDENNAYDMVYDLAWNECRRREDWSFDHKQDMDAEKIADDPPEEE